MNNTNYRENAQSSIIMKLLKVGIRFKKNALLIPILLGCISIQIVRGMVCSHTGNIIPIRYRYIYIYVYK